MMWSSLAAAALAAASVGLLAQPEAPLSGPKVRDRPGGMSFGLGGELRRATVRPEEAVLKTLALDAATREAVDHVLNARGRVLVKFILGNIDLLNRLNVTGSTGDKLATVALLSRALGRLEAMGFQGDVTSAVRAALPTGLRAAFDRGMDEFWVGVAMEKTGKPRGGLRVGDVYGARLEESGRIFGQELEAAFQRAERSGEFVAAYLLDGLNLSEAQRERIDGMVFSKLDMMGADLPEEERNKLFVGIMAYLTADQQAKLMRKIRGE